MFDRADSGLYRQVDAFAAAAMGDGRFAQFLRRHGHGVEFVQVELRSTLHGRSSEVDDAGEHDLHIVAVAAGAYAGGGGHGIDNLLGEERTMLIRLVDNCVSACYTTGYG